MICFCDAGIVVSDEDQVSLSRHFRFLRRAHLLALAAPLPRRGRDAEEEVRELGRDLVQVRAGAETKGEAQET